jgi:hypothetical protein
MVNDVLCLPKGILQDVRLVIIQRIVFRFFEWKKNVSKMPFFIYQSEPFLNEKHYPDINIDTNFENRLPLLAMAGIFDINRNCEVCFIHVLLRIIIRSFT